MTKFLAHVAIITAAFGLQFATYWYVFGLWPRSWMAFGMCWSGSILLKLAYDFVEREN